ncbi:hypothetical protein ABZ329_29145 [Streptomyces rubiginosohelvolus]|uniref:hypothetical protein n=1 Tax=Streptomyces rubiginosohelvolus TaxID=67362 RepID=UPI0034058B79
MGAPRSLVAVPQQERKPRTYEEVVRAVYNDERANPEARELLLAVAYAVYLKGREEGVSPLREARRVLGRTAAGRPRYDGLMAADVPRYETPRDVDVHAHTVACQAPRLRPYRPKPAVPYEPDPHAPSPIRSYELPPELAALKAEAMAAYTPPRDWRTEDGVCGANSRYRVLEKDPVTGWVSAHWFCRRHQDHADRVTEQLRAQNDDAPAPLPNRGGLLPCYFKADWEKVYRHYAGRLWEPPAHGLCADDWPTPGQGPAVKKGRMRLVLGGDLDGPR